MKRKRFSVEQIVAVVKQAELGLPVADLIRRVASRNKLFIAGRRNTPVWNRTRRANSSNWLMKTRALRSWWPS
jgi:putative transposase